MQGGQDEPDREHDEAVQLLREAGVRRLHA